VSRAPASCDGEPVSIDASPGGSVSAAPPHAATVRTVKLVIAVMDVRRLSDRWLGMVRPL